MTYDFHIPTIRRVLGYFICVICLGAEMPYSFGKPTCAGGAFNYYSIWGPQTFIDNKWSVAKWEKPIDIVIIDDTQGSSRFTALKDKLLSESKRFMDAAGIDITIASMTGSQSGNVAFAVSNDLPTTNSRLRKLQLGLFRGAGYSEEDSSRAVADLNRFWLEKSPICGGFITSNLHHGVVGAYLFVSGEQDGDCVVTALGAMFGLHRNRIAVGEGRPAPQDAGAHETEILGAVREMYNAKIVNGMNDSEVRNVMAEMCK